MKYKRLTCAVVAFLMVGVNLGGVVQAFADGGEMADVTGGVVENTLEGGGSRDTRC